MSDIKTVLYEHIPHPKLSRCVTSHDVRTQMRAEGGLNTRTAVWLTKRVGSMWTAYLFTLLAFVGLLGVLSLLSPIVYTLVAWTSQTLIQLTLLPIIMVGQAVLGKHQEMISEKSFHDIEQIMNHLDSQDATILAIASKVEQMEKIETTEVLKMADMLTEILDIVKFHSQAIALTSAGSYEPVVRPEQPESKKGRTKA